MLWPVVITLSELIEEAVALEPDVVEAGEGADEDQKRFSKEEKT